MSKNVILLGIVMSIVGGVALFNAVFSTYEMIKYPDYATAATSSNVTVSAAISTSISCSTSIGSTDFGTWTNTEIKTAASNASSTMACANTSGGCNLYVKDVGSTTAAGLWKAPDSIESPNAAFDATTTLADGTEGYGIKAATTTVGSGALFGIPARYRNTGANDIGGLQITNTAIATTTATTSGREIIVTHMAAIAAGTPSGSYSDTITYECTAN